MLVQFSVENFLSFDEEQIFSMVAAGGDQHPQHLVQGVPRKGEALLRGAAFFGANGAGKSNLIEALHFAKTLIVEGRRSSQTLPVRPFKLGKGGNGRSSKFEFVFSAQGITYNYGFRLETTRVLEEWLFATPKTHEVLFFQRATNEAGAVEVEFGPSFTGRSGKDRQFLEFVARGTRPNQLFLTEAVERNVTAAKPVAEWFQKSLLILSAETPVTHLEMYLQEDQSLTDFLQTVLRDTGTGVEGVTSQERPFDLGQLSSLPEDSLEQIKAQIAAAQAVVVNLYGPQEERLILKQDERGQVTQVLLKMQHRSQDGQFVEFKMEEESDGTQRLINLIPALFMLRHNPDQVLVIDELDRRLHPLLSRFFVQAALDAEGRQKQSQLIFTTHDTHLLDLALLRRDELWFVEKDNGGASHLYSLAEFKARPDLRVERGYLSGRFGAVPLIGDAQALGLQLDALDKTAQALQKSVWMERIATLPDYLIEETCLEASPYGMTPEETDAVIAFLKERRSRLPFLVHNASIEFKQPAE